MCILSRINLSSPRILSTTRYSRWSGNARFLDLSGKFLGAHVTRLGIICKASPTPSWENQPHLRSWVWGYRAGKASKQMYPPKTPSFKTKAKAAWFAGFIAGMLAAAAERNAKSQTSS
jgi:hypothetical protein